MVALTAGLGDSGVKTLLSEWWRRRPPNPREQMSAWNSGKGRKKIQSVKRDTDGQKL